MLPVLRKCLCLNLSPQSNQLTSPAAEDLHAAYVRITRCVLALQQTSFNQPSLLAFPLHTFGETYAFHHNTRRSEGTQYHVSLLFLQRLSMAILSYPFNSSESSCSRNSRVEKEQKTECVYYFISDPMWWWHFVGKDFLMNCLWIWIGWSVFRSQP